MNKKVVLRIIKSNKYLILPINKNLIIFLNLKFLPKY